MRTAVFVLEAVVVILSFLAGCGVVGGPEPARIALAFFSIVVIPGHALSSLVFRAGASTVEGACRLFAMGLVFVSVVLCAGFVPGVSYPIISAASSLLVLALLFFARGARKRPGGAGSPGRAAGRPSGPADARAAIVGGFLFALCAAAFAGTGELGWETDAPDHVSYVRRSVESGVLFPRDSFYREGDGIAPDPRKGLWHPVLSLWTYQAHAPADRVWRHAPAFLSFFALCSFLFFAIELCGASRCVVLSLVCFLLFYGGDGVGWLAKAGFSRNVAQVALWLDLGFLFAYYRAGRRAHLVAAALLACVGTAFHLVFAMLLAVSLAGILCYVVFTRSGAPWRGAFWRSAPLLLAGASIPLAIRAPGALVPSNAIHTHLQGMLVFSSRLAIVDPAELLTRYGLIFFYVLLAAPFLPAIADRVERRGLALALYFVPLILVLDPLIAAALERRIGYLHYRILDAAPLAVVIALAASGLARVIRSGGAPRGARPRALFSARGSSARVLAGALLALFIAYPVRTASVRAVGTARALFEKRAALPPAYGSLFAALDTELPDHSTIASDPATSYLISALTDHFVTVVLDQHCSPADTAAIERLREARNLMSPAMPLAASAAWLERSGAEYVLVNGNLPERADFFNSFLSREVGKTREKFLACPSRAIRVLERDGFTLFELRRDDADALGADGCAAAIDAAHPCVSPDDSSGGGAIAAGGGADLGEGIALVSLVVDNEVLGAGDTLAAHLCWRAARAIEFGLPLDVIVRIDAPFPRGSLYREWYGKQYRRMIERRGGRYYRFTARTRLMSGPAYPDMLGAGAGARQDFALPLPASLAPGAYEVLIKVIRAPYLENRRVADYLSNDDSLQGVPVGMIYLRPEPPNGSSGAAGAGPAFRGGR